MGIAGLSQHLIRPAFRLDRAQVKPLMGIECATAIGVSLAVGLLTGHAGDGAWGAIGAFLTNFAVFQPGYRIRVRIVVAAAVVVAFGILLGAVSGIEHPAIFPVVAVWVFLSGMLVAAGQNAAIIGVVSSVGLIVASSLNASPWLALREAGTALAGGLLVTVLVPAFHWRSRRPESSALAAAYRTLAIYASSIGTGVPALPEAAAFDTLASTLAMPGSHRTRYLAGRDRALARQAERLRTSLAAMAQARDHLATGRSGSTALGRSPSPSTAPAVEAIDSCAAAVGALLLDAAHCCATDADPLPPGAEDDQLVAVQQALDRSPHLVALVTEIRSHLAEVRHLLATPGDPHSRPARTDTTSTAVSASRTAVLTEMLSTVRANLTLRSTACRHALRLAVVATVCTGLYRIIDVHDGYWIVVAVLFIMKPDFGSTVGRGVLRIVGTLVGVSLTTLLLATLQPQPWLLAVLTVVTSAFAYALFSANYGAFTVFLTCLTVFLAAFDGLPPLTAVGNRTVDNLIGAGLAIVAAVVWPTWVATEVPQLVAACIRAEHRFCDTVLSAFTRHGSPSGDQVDGLVAEARLARSNAEAAVERMGAETPGARKGTLDLSTAEEMLAQMHRYGLAGLSLWTELDQAPRVHPGDLGARQAWITTHSEALARAIDDATGYRLPLAPVLAAVATGWDELTLAVVDEVAVMEGAVGRATEIFNEGRAAVASGN